MYYFAIIAMMAIGVIKVVDFLVDLIPEPQRSRSRSWETHPAVRSVLTFAAAIAAVWALDFNVFSGWAIEVRNHATGVWVTGFMVSGFTVPWRAAFRWLTHDSSTIDEPLGQHAMLRNVA
jgi:hypothetical protein